MSQSSRAIAALMIRWAARTWLVGGVIAAEPPPQPSYDVPDGVAVQQLLLAGVGAFADDAGDPVIQPAHLLIAGRAASRWQPGRCAGARAVLPAGSSSRARG